MISVIIPANNEEGYIGPCLQRILNSTNPDGSVQVVVVANGCTDETVPEARAYTHHFTARGWQLDILDLKDGGKIGALNAGDRVAKFGSRVYVDADIHMSPELLRDLGNVLSASGPVFASGRPHIRKATNYFSERYARFWEQLPFMAEGVPGCGVYAVNSAGRARWAEFPRVIADDTFARYHFSKHEMRTVQSSYSWPITEGFRSLVRVRRRQNDGLTQIRRLYPELAARMPPTSPTMRQKAKLFFRDPVGFLIYSTVAVAVRLPVWKTHNPWHRGR